MVTALFSHPDSSGHVTPPGHPERVERIEAINTALAHSDFDALLRPAVPMVEDEALLRCHPQSYLDKVAAAIPSDGYVSLDGDTHVMSGSLDAARRSAGAAIAAVDLVLDGGARNAFCAHRPPGHHAERSTAMGFCIFGTVAVAAKHALDVRGLSRVAVIDFDVHHGNGTQDLIWNEERCLFVSTHQSPLYPGTGSTEERGAHNQIVNLPLRAFTDGDTYRSVFDGYIAPAVDTFKPELILVSAGFDAHSADPLASLSLETEDFAWITGRLCDLANAHCGGKLVSCLEGGYDLTALADSVAAHVAVLMERGA